MTNSISYGCITKSSIISILNKLTNTRL